MLKKDPMPTAHALPKDMAAQVPGSRGFRGILAAAAVIACALLAAPPQASASDISLTSFTATPGDGKVTLEWSVANAVSWASVDYRFYRWKAQGTDFSGQTTCNSSPCDNTGLTNGVEYKFEGWACQSFWSKVQGYISQCTSKTTVFATPAAE